MVTVLLVHERGDLPADDLAVAIERDGGRERDLCVVLHVVGVGEVHCGKLSMCCSLGWSGRWW
jgi:hypothetical protein